MPLRIFAAFFLGLTFCLFGYVSASMRLIDSGCLSVSFIPGRTENQTPAPRIGSTEVQPYCQKFFRPQFKDGIADPGLKQSDRAGLAEGGQMKIAS